MINVAAISCLGQPGEAVGGDCHECRHDRRRDHPQDSRAGCGWRTAATCAAAALNDTAVTAALHAVHRDPAAPWTVAKPAAEAGLSRAAFARGFSALIGQQPLGYLTWWRLTMAARLLRATQAPLRSIAAQVGYTSEFAFANAFKRAHGLAPGAYRRRS